MFSLLPTSFRHNFDWFKLCAITLSITKGLVSSQTTCAIIVFDSLFQKNSFRIDEDLYVKGKRAATLLVPVSITFYLSEFYIKNNSFRFVRVSFIELLIFNIKLRLIIR